MDLVHQSVVLALPSLLLGFPIVSRRMLVAFDLATGFRRFAVRTANQSPPIVKTMSLSPTRESNMVQENNEADDQQVRPLMGPAVG